jgi:hypothetical protein
MHTYIYTYTYLHTYIHTYMHTYMHTCMHTYKISPCIQLQKGEAVPIGSCRFSLFYIVEVSTCFSQYVVSACMHVYIYLFVYVCMYVCMYLCMYMYVCMYVCIAVATVEVKRLDRYEAATKGEALFQPFHLF